MLENMEIHVKGVFLGQLDQKLLQVLFINMRIMAKTDQKNAKTPKWLATGQKSIFFQNSFFLFFVTILVTNLAAGEEDSAINASIPYFIPPPNHVELTGLTD